MAKEIENNWNSKLERLQCIIKVWSKRNLSIQGKVINVKAFLVSQLVYIMQSVDLQRQAVLHKVNRLLYIFWQKRFSSRRAFENVNRKVLEAAHSKGRLNKINVPEFQKQKLAYSPTVASKYNCK